MKFIRPLIVTLFIFSLFTGCGSEPAAKADGTKVLTTTYPMYFLTSRLMEDVEDVTVEVLVQEQVSCLHDYTLTTTQMKTIEQADLLVINGCGLEHFLDAALSGIPEGNVIDASGDLTQDDPHYWLSIPCYQAAAATVANALTAHFPDWAQLICANRDALTEELSGLHSELSSSLSSLSCRELITFHDGFSLFAESLELTVAAAIEEEEGAEASAQQIQQICTLIREHNIPAVFVEKNGSTNAADIISSETGVAVYVLNTMMDGATDYFTAMRENAAVIREAYS